MTDGIRVATLGDIPEGEGVAVSREVTGAADAIAILRDQDGSVWALNNTCPGCRTNIVAIRRWPQCS